MKSSSKIVKIVVGLVVVAAVALLWVRGRGHLPVDAQEIQESAALPPPESLTESRAVAAPAGEASKEVDLLDHVRASRDSVAGTWGFQDRGLITASDAWGRLQLPCWPPEEYDLRLRVTRKKGTDSLILGLVTGGRQAVAALDGHDGKTSWLYLSDSLYDFSNTTTVSRKVFKWNKPTTVVAQVRASGISISVDGEPVVQWRGDPSELQMPPGHRVPDSKALFIGSWETAFRIDEISLIPITGKPTFRQ
jgi:hypothetical protein